MNRVSIRSALVVLALSSGCAGAEPSFPGSDESIGKSEQALTSVNVWHGTWNGGSAYADVSSETSYASVSASENKSRGTRTVALSIFAYSFDPASLVCETETICWDPADPSTCEDYEYCYYTDYSYSFGWGEIPKADFSVGKRTAELHTNLASDPNFTGTTCTPAGCSALTGTIDLSWAANGYYSSSTNGTSSYSYNFDGVAYTAKSTGQWSDASANVSGSILGTSADAASGAISESKGSSVSKDIIKN